MSLGKQWLRIGGLLLLLVIVLSAGGLGRINTSQPFDETGTDVAVTVSALGRTLLADARLVCVGPSQWVGILACLICIVVFGLLGVTAETDPGEKRKERGLLILLLAFVGLLLCRYVKD